MEESQVASVSLPSLAFAGTPAVALAMVLGCQDAPTSTSSDLSPPTSGLEAARGRQAMSLTARPTTLAFLLPDVTPATVQAQVQFLAPWEDIHPHPAAAADLEGP